MSTLPDYELSDRYLRTSGTVLLTGIHALARLPIEQLRRDAERGMRTASFVSGYPGSPLGGFDLEMQRAVRIAPDLPIVHQPAVNEELGATAVMGSQLAPGRPDATYEGVLGIWYGKAPGLDRACDALRHGVFAGTHPNGGAVALVGDDPACKSSTMPSSSDATLVDLHMPIFYPGTVAECLELGLHAVAISRATGLWASMKIVTPIADGSGTVELPVLTDDPEVPTIEVDGRPWRCEPSAQFLGPRMLEVEREFREIRMPLARRYGSLNRLNQVTANPGDAWLGIVATGYTYHQTVDALRRLGLTSMRAIEDAGIRMLHLRMPVPFDTEIVRTFAPGLEKIVVIEEKNPTLEWLIKDALYGSLDTPPVVGKHDTDGSPLFPSWGMLDADAIVGPLRSVLTPLLAARLAPAPPSPRERIPLEVRRTPFFCSGCPHNWGTKVPDGALVGAGTGCHGMTLLMDAERVGEGIGITAMGNEGAQWIGMEPFVAADHLFQNYGDGTLFHSGQLAIQNCIGAGKKMTFKILYNSTVAMTGGQDSVSTLTVPALVAMVRSWGVAAVAITTEDPGRYRDLDLPSEVTVHDRAEIVEVQERLRQIDGVTVLIHDQECAAELRRDRKRGLREQPRTRVVINERICEGCGDCGDVSNCLSVQPVDTFFGRKTRIDQASCNFDYSCLKGDCPAFMTVKLSDDSGSGEGPLVAGAAGAARARAGGSVEALPDPPGVGARGSARIRLAGIGGTGVVTIAQLVGTAAMLDGWEVHGVDQTGLSQKAGPVVSDVILTRADTASNLIGTGEADVVLAFDGLVAASDPVIGASGPGTTVVASATTTPTGAMITHPELPYPAGAVATRLDVASHGAVVDVDATEIASAVAGPAQSNAVLLGVAVQLGLVPVSLDAIRRAIELNGVAVDANLAALDAGRRFAVGSTSPDAAQSTRADRGPSLPEPDPAVEKRIGKLGLPGALAAIVTTLASDLVLYQDLAYASTYLDRVEEAVLASRDLEHGDGDRLVETIARSMHKLMAYKDEYEVARLMTDHAAERAVESVGGSGASFSWHLHPPMLKALGLHRKVGIPGVAEPVFRTLARGRRLRGTWADPFGRTEMRRTERRLPQEFADTLRSLYAGLRRENVDVLIEIAALPDMVRGYEELKMRRIAEYEQALAAAVTRYRAI